MKTTHKIISFILSAFITFAFYYGLLIALPKEIAYMFYKNGVYITTDNILLVFFPLTGACTYFALTNTNPFPTRKYAGKNLIEPLLALVILAFSLVGALFKVTMDELVAIFQEHSQ